MRATRRAWVAACLLMALGTVEATLPDAWTFDVTYEEGAIGFQVVVTSVEGESDWTHFAVSSQCSRPDGPVRAGATLDCPGLGTMRLWHCPSSSLVASFAVDPQQPEQGDAYCTDRNQTRRMDPTANASTVSEAPPSAPPAHNATFVHGAPVLLAVPPGESRSVQTTEVRVTFTAGGQGCSLEGVLRVSDKSDTAIDGATDVKAGTAVRYVQLQHGAGDWTCTDRVRIALDLPDGTVRETGLVWSYWTGSAWTRITTETTFVPGVNRTFDLQVYGFATHPDGSAWLEVNHASSFAILAEGPPGATQSGGTAPVGAPSTGWTPVWWTLGGATAAVVVFLAFRKRPSPP